MIRFLFIIPDGEEEVERGNWGNQIEFVLTCVSYAGEFIQAFYRLLLCLLMKNDGDYVTVQLIIFRTRKKFPNDNIT